MRRNVIFVLYRALLWLAFPALLLYLAFRAARSRAYWLSLGERFGALPGTFQQTGPGAVWLHAVSVGEVLTSIKLLKLLREGNPGVRLYVSTSTTAGRALAHEKLATLADGVFYAPLDYPFAVRRVFQRLRPRVLIVQETEIWPNLWREAGRHGAALLVVNGRISDKAFPKYERLRWFFREVVTLPDRILAQSQVSLERFRALGAEQARTGIGGNLKYDFDPAGQAPPPEIAEALKDAERIWIAASTMPGEPDEDAAVIGAFQQLVRTWPRLALVLAPRKPERFDEAAEKLVRAGVAFLRRSALEPGSRVPPGGALLLDSIGELSGLFPLADVVFVGGTIVAWGGHNILEPAFFAKPVVTGRHMHNFPEIAGEFRAGGAVVTVDGPEGLAAAVEGLLAAPGGIGNRARALAEARRGATARAAAAVRELYLEAVPRQPHGLLRRLALGPLAAAWRAGVRWRRRRQSRTARSLPVPVVSVGGIAMGGAGKTPFAIWLAGKLPAPAFLTRGYRRRSLDPVLVFGPGERASPLQTGDEAQLLLRSGLGPVAVGSDRYRAGIELLKRFQPRVFVLDDGFQHWRLSRGGDLVLIDALDPFPGGAAFPLGRLREEPEALARAKAVVIHRAAEPWPGLERELRRHTSAPVFYSRIVPKSWWRWPPGGTLAPGEMRERKATAFCGLGNPASFWATLAGLGIAPLRRWAFGDHHRYRPRELRQLALQARATGAEVLLTTEKDVQNLPAGAAAMVAPLEIWWLEIGLEVEREAELLALLGPLRESRQ